MYVAGDVVEVVDERCQHHGCIGTIVRGCNIMGATLVVQFDGDNKVWGIPDEWVPFGEHQLKKVVS